MTAVLIGILLALIGFFWWGFRLGRRTGFYFFLPYAIFMIGVLVFMCPNYGNGMEILIYVAGTIEFLAFLWEFFLCQPKCLGCKRRLGMKRIATSDLGRYDYIGTKDNKAVSKTDLQFTAHYICKYCGTQTSRGEIETYVNE